MPQFKIRYALGGSFGGTKNKDWEIIEADDEEDASNIAWEMACEEYEGYAGLYGLRSISQIMDEEGYDEEDAEAQFEQERESWVTYEVEPVKESDIKPGE